MNVGPHHALGFASTHDVLAAEKLLLEMGMSVKAIPAPASLGGSLCGLALRVEAAEAARARGALEEAGMPPMATVTLS